MKVKVYIMELSELTLLVEAEVALRGCSGGFIMYESGQDAKSAIGKIMDAIKEFFKNLSKNIQQWYMENGIKKKISALKRVVDKDPRIAAERDNSLRIINIAALQKNYNKYISSLKSLNTELPEDIPPEELEKYVKRLDSLHESYQNSLLAIIDISNRSVLNMIAASRMIDIVDDAESMLNEIQTNGVKSFPEPKNAYIGKAFTKASVCCSKLARISQSQISKTLMNARIFKIAYKFNLA